MVRTGRPKKPGPPKQTLGARVDPDVLQEVDRAAKRFRIDRSDVARFIIERGLRLFRVDGRLVDESETRLPGSRADVEAGRKAHEQMMQMRKEFEGKLEVRESGYGEELPMPELGYVQAGPRGLIPYEFAKKIQVPQHYHRRGARYVLRARGDSMIDLGILDGDVLFVKPGNRAETGQTVIALLNGNAMVKEYEQKAGKVRLLSRNPAYEPVEVSEEDDLLIQGIVVGKSGDL